MPYRHAAKTVIADAKTLDMFWNTERLGVIQDANAIMTSRPKLRADGCAIPTNALIDI